MRSSRRAASAVGLRGGLLAFALASSAHAQPAAPGFALERLYQSAPGAGWIALDALDMHGGLGATAALSVSYANNPLRVSQGAHALPVVSDEATADLGFAVSYERLRLSLDFASPLSITGQSGTAGGFVFTAPSDSFAQTPDTIADVRIGLDARVVGGPTSRFRLGFGAQLYVPSGTPAEYVSDDTYRAMLRVLAAGDLGNFTYAGELGVHIRPTDDGSVPGAPRGSELLFGVAGGTRVLFHRGASLVVGPELFGETALKSLFGAATTGVEGLVSARLERSDDADRLGLRLKVGAGGGRDAQFGVPEWRTVVGVEVFGRAAQHP